MGKIQVLDQKTINKIAAGEVVESPRSVVKELTENAIDAGASTITVELKDGGISYIRVTDNGCGIPKEDVKEAFLPHATSKLSKIEDLEHIYTMGFRGEALASIAAVAQVEMTTKTKEEEIGTYIEISGGEIKNIQDTACTEGTTIVVKNLFYNVPARRKFLKKPSTESNHVSDLMNKLALGHPALSFCYINNDSTLLHTAGTGDGKASVFYVYGKEAANAMMEISFARGDYKLTGLVGKPELSRANRNYENLFINGRFIKNSIVSSAVEDAYKTRIMIGKFPVYVLNLEVDAAQVDVNVHPAKLEVRFKNDNEVYDFFYDAVTQVFQDKVLIPKASWEKNTDTVVSENEKEIQTESVVSKEPELLKTDEKAEEKEIEKLSESPLELPKEKFWEKQVSTDKEAATQKETPMRTVDQLLKKKPPTQMSVQEESTAFVVDAKEDFVIEQEEIALPKENIPPSKETVTPFFNHYRIVGQLFATYWVVEQGDCIYLIDQHAAHERILYEKLMKGFREEKVVSQKLLTPVMLHLTETEKELLMENQALLEGFGFGFEKFSEEAMALNAVPFLMKEPSETGFFTDILDTLGTGNPENVYDMKILAVATMACKAAVKGHDHLSIQEAEALITELLKLENPFTCPHGRPTIIELTRYELEKKFKRIQN